VRHSAATIALDQGVALAVVQEKLGHSDIRVTRGYTHVSSLLTQDAAARLGRPCSEKLLRKLLRGAMIVNTLLAFPLVRWSRLSESNRRPIHYE
jgi:Phage integrase family